jgi:integrase
MAKNNKYAGIVTEKNGTYTVKTTLTYKDGFPKYVTKRGFFTKTEALNYKNKLAEEISNTYYQIESKKQMSLHSYFDLYLEEYSLSNKPSTTSGVRGMVNLYLKKFTRDVSLNDIKPTELRHFRTQLNAVDKLNSDSKNERLSLLKRILTSAIDKGYLDNQLGRLCILELQPIASDGHIIKNDYWEYDEYLRFINSFEDDDKYKLLFTCLFCFGCRISEFRALQFKDLIVETNQIHIYKQVTSKLRTGKYEIVNYTKTNRDRYTNIPRSIVNQLLKHKEENNYTDEDYLFFGATPISENAINNKRHKHCELAKVKLIRNHDFRHSYITYLIDNELDFKIVAEQVGHTDVSTTMNIYNHVSNKRKDKLNNVLDDMFKQ